MQPVLFYLPRIALSLLPVVVFLIALVALDSFRLVNPRKIFISLLAGVFCAIACFFINSIVVDLTRLPTLTFALFVAPLVEEAAKGAFLIWMIRSGRAGFLIDAAIIGFATGAGFSIVENTYYMVKLSDAPMLVWIIRGFGTAIMHGGVTAVFAITVKGLDRHEGLGRWWFFLPGVTLAVLLHSSFNRFMVQPILVTGLLLIILPSILRVTYALGERRLRNWLGRGFDRDTELLALIRDGQVKHSPLGRYLYSLQDAFRLDKVADMLCLVRLQTELSIRAKGMLVLSEHGMRPAPDPELHAKLEEVRWLERSVGRTGLLALRPISRWRGRNLWQRRLLEDSEKN